MITLVHLFLNPFYVLVNATLYGEETIVGETKRIVSARDTFYGRKYGYMCFGQSSPSIF